MTVKIRGGVVPFLAKHLYITSNNHPSDCNHPSDWYDSEKYPYAAKAILGRINYFYYKKSVDSEFKWIWKRDKVKIPKINFKLSDALPDEFDEDGHPTLKYLNNH